MYHIMLISIVNISVLFSDEVSYKVQPCHQNIYTPRATRAAMFEAGVQSSENCFDDEIQVPSSLKYKAHQGALRVHQKVQPPYGGLLSSSCGGLQMVGPFGPTFSQIFLERFFLENCFQKFFFAVNFLFRNFFSGFLFLNFYFKNLFLEKNFGNFFVSGIFFQDIFFKTIFSNLFFSHIFV